MATSDKAPRRTRRRQPPATTPEARENQLIALAVDLAEEQIAEGTASAQVITHYLKLGTTRERLEQEKLAQENELLKSKIKAMDSAEGMMKRYEDALSAFRGYAGQEVEPYDEP